MISTRLVSIVLTFAIFLANAVLAMLLARLYVKGKSISSLIWSTGMRIFAIAIILELLFAFGVYSGFLARVYLFAIAMPLLAFGIGHMQFVKSKRIKQAYYYYNIALAFILIYALYASNIGSIFNGYEVYGVLPLSVTVLSLVIAASALIVVSFVAVKDYVARKNPKVLAIIPGAVLFLLNDALHFATASPLMLYYYQLLGIALVWIGFVGLVGVREYPL